MRRSARRSFSGRGRRDADRAGRVLVEPALLDADVVGAGGDLDAERRRRGDGQRRLGEVAAEDRDARGPGSDADRGPAPSRDAEAVQGDVVRARPLDRDARRRGVFEVEIPADDQPVRARECEHEAFGRRLENGLAVEDDLDGRTLRAVAARLVDAEGPGVAPGADAQPVSRGKGAERRLQVVPGTGLASVARRRLGGDEDGALLGRKRRRLRRDGRERLSGHEVGLAHDERGGCRHRRRRNGRAAKTHRDDGDGEEGGGADAKTASGHAWERNGGDATTRPAS